MFNIAGVVLAGGKSTRMKSDKKELIFNGETFLNIAKNNLKSSNCHNIYVSLAKASTKDKNIIEDNIKNIGPLSGVLCALGQIKSDYIVFIPIDMPLLKPTIIKYLIDNINENSMAIHYENHIFPFIIKNSQPVIDIINNQIESKAFSLFKLLKNLNATTIIFNDDEKYLQNINYQEDFLRLTKC